MLSWLGCARLTPSDGFVYWSKEHSLDTVLIHVWSVYPCIQSTDHVCDFVLLVQTVAWLLREAPSSSLELQPFWCWRRWFRSVRCAGAAYAGMHGMRADGEAVLVIMDASTDGGIFSTCIAACGVDTEESVQSYELTIEYQLRIRRHSKRRVSITYYLPRGKTARSSWINNLSGARHTLKTSDMLQTCYLLAAIFIHSIHSRVLRMFLLLSSIKLVFTWW